MATQTDLENLLLEAALAGLSENMGSVQQVYPETMADPTLDLPNPIYEGYQAWQRSRGPLSMALDLPPTPDKYSPLGPTPTGFTPEAKAFLPTLKDMGPQPTPPPTPRTGQKPQYSSGGQPTPAPVPTEIVSPQAPQPTHTMPGGTTMPGAEHPGGIAQTLFPDLAPVQEVPYGQRLTDIAGMMPSSIEGLAGPMPHWKQPGFFTRMAAAALLGAGGKPYLQYKDEKQAMLEKQYGEEVAFKKERVKGLQETAMKTLEFDMNKQKEQQTQRVELLKQAAAANPDVLFNPSWKKAYMTAYGISERAVDDVIAKAKDPKTGMLREGALDLSESQQAAKKMQDTIKWLLDYKIVDNVTDAKAMAMGQGAKVVEKYYDRKKFLNSELNRLSMSPPTTDNNNLVNKYKTELQFMEANMPEPTIFKKGVYDLAAGQRDALLARSQTVKNPAERRAMENSAHESFNNIMKLADYASISKDLASTYMRGMFSLQEEKLKLSVAAAKEGGVSEGGRLTMIKEYHPGVKAAPKAALPQQIVDRHVRVMNNLDTVAQGSKDPFTSEQAYLKENPVDQETYMSIRKQSINVLTRLNFKPIMDASRTYPNGKIPLSVLEPLAVEAYDQLSRGIDPETVHQNLKGSMQKIFGVTAK